MTRYQVLTILVPAWIALGLMPLSRGDSIVVLTDPAQDVAIRRSDPGANGAIDPVAHRPPDLLACIIGSWEPDDAHADPFSGEWEEDGEFFRLDLRLDGLINPPGTLGGEFPFDPFRYGPNPVFGYVEIDMDEDEKTGGETAVPELRYLGNVARVGGVPRGGRFDDRVALGAEAFDHTLSTKPYVDRSGEEFHLALHGWQISTIDRSDPSDLVFGPGETWVVTGWLLHRAHGYEPFSYACCTGAAGSYEPEVRLRFQHDVEKDRTTITLVYPLTNEASAAMMGSAFVEPLDPDAANQNSVLEALNELAFAATFPLPEWRIDPDFPLIERWKDKNPNSFLEPDDWRVTVLVGTSYTEPDQDAFFVWTDLFPNVVVGDFNGDGCLTHSDLEAFDEFRLENDGVAGRDEDGILNGSVDLLDFGPNFSVFDLNYDGVVDEADRLLIGPIRVAPDLDRDGDVDQTDFGLLQACLGRPVSMSPDCHDADFDDDDDVDAADLNILRACESGPTVPATPGCEQ